ncbi:MAG: hypothetical protein K2Q01_00890 [Rickettsiales bacterium]|nr:hypothetical protein [Rickettsiales bacterium]
MPQLDPTWFASQIFWLALCFGLLYVLLSRVVLPPLMGTMAQRSGTIASDIESAQTLKLEAEQARIGYEKTMAEARSKAQSVVNEAVADQKAKAEAKGKELERQIEQKLAAATQQIEGKKAAMMEQLAPATKELASLIVEKLTQASPTEEEVNEAIRVKGRR